MKHLLTLFFIISTQFIFSQAGGTNCADMEPICTDAGVSFTANSGGPNASTIDPGNNYDCLFTSPNPSWFYLEISDAGNVDMSLTAPSDIDFIIWGPFNSLTAAQNSCGSMTNVVDCSYSATANETPQITNAQVGQVYVLLVTNYANTVQNISLTQTGGTGGTDCTILDPECLITFFEANISACINGTGSYDVTGVVEYQDAPTTGNLIVQDCFGTQHIVASAPFPAGGVVNYTIPGLPANGAACSLTTFFSADPTCQNGPLNYTAPTCDCSFTNIETTISACDPNDNTFSVSGLVEFINPPATGQLIIEDCNGNQQVFNAPFTSPTNYNLAGLNSDGTLNCQLTATFTANTACTISTLPYNNPANCTCGAVAGTFTDGVVGDANSTNPWLLCFGDELDIIGNSDFSVTENPLIAATYDPGIWLLVYDCPPTIAPPNLINDDPCLLGVASTADQAWTIVNNSGDGATLYFVPLTMYSMVDGTYAISLNGGDWCYDLGPTYPVTFLPEVTTTQVQDCQAGTATVTINGGAPAFDGSNFTGANLSPATATFSNSTAANGGTITISGLVDGDAWSFDISDNNGCPITVSGNFIGVEDPAFTYPSNTYCQDELDPGATITGDLGGAFSAAPAGLSINTVSGLIDLSASTPGTYTVTYTTADPICFDQATFVITINPVPVIDPIANVTSCLEYILPAITGTNLTGGQSYYTGPGGTGTILAPGAIINTIGATTIYIYDETGTVPNCFDETSFDVTILPAIQDMTCPPGLTAVCSITEQPAYANYNDFITAGGSVTLPAGAVVDPTTFNLVSEVSDGLTCPETITRTYAVTDECGITVSCEQIIIVNDIINPSGNAPANVTVQCAADAPAIDINSLIGVSDNCGAPVVTHVGDVTNGLTCPEIITRTYRIEDACGNFIEVQQVITINDDIAPLGTAPAAVNVQCPTDVPAANIADVTGVSDNCTANPIVLHVGDVSDGNTCPEVITRTYSITDDCGNETLVTQIITINDDIDPVATAPADIIVACQSDIPAPNISDVTGVSDNCTANPVVEHLGDVSDNNVCNGEVITRTYLITDGCGNSITVTQLITISSITPTFTLTPTNPAECAAADGQILISGLLPTTSYNLSFNGSNSIVVTTNAAGEHVISGLTQGNYTDFVISLANCPMCETADNSVINLVDPNAPALNAGPDVQICEGEEITLTAVNPDGAIITWNNGVTNGIAFNQNVGTTTYTVTANLDNCISTDQVDVTVHPTPNVFAGNDVVVCAGQSAVLTGSGAQSYSWNNGITNGVAFTPTQTQNYIVTGTSQFGCIATDDVTVTVEELPAVSFEGNNLEGCVPVTTTFTNTGLTEPGNECIWYLSDGTILTGCDNVAYTFNNPGCYDVTLEVTSPNGCSSSSTFEDYVCVQAYPVAYFTFSPNQPTTINTQVTFSNGSIGASNYEWFFGDGATSNAVDPTHTYAEVEETYEVTLVASTSFGCTDTARSIINIVEELIFYVPNTFTPDGDEFNETFQPVFTSGFDPFDFHLMIFNRWGELIFESYDASIGWDGTYGGKANGADLVKDGTYVWKIEVKTKISDERKMFVGHVNVLK